MKRLFSTVLAMSSLMVSACATPGDYYYSFYGPERHVSGIITTMFEVYVHDDVVRDYGIILCKELNNGKSVEYYLFAVKMGGSLLGNDPLTLRFNLKNAALLTRDHIMSILSFIDIALASWPNKQTSNKYGSYTVTMNKPAGMVVEMALSYRLSGNDQSFSIFLRNEHEIQFTDKEKLQEFKLLLSSALVPVLSPKKKIRDYEAEIKKEKDEIERLKVIRNK